VGRAGAAARPGGPAAAGPARVSLIMCHRHWHRGRTPSQPEVVYLYRDAEIDPPSRTVTVIRTSGRPVARLGSAEPE
jgi:hypothetical protein